jgi:hypothetical protein
MLLLDIRKNLLFWITGLTVGGGSDGFLDAPGEDSQLLTFILQNPYQNTRK